MLNKKGMMLTAVFIVSLLAISAVSAAENATDDISMQADDGSVNLEDSNDYVVSEDDDYSVGTSENDYCYTNASTGDIDTRKDRSSSFYFEELGGNYTLGESRSFGIGCLDFDYDEDLSTVSFLVDGNEVGVQDLCEYEPSDIDPLGGNFIDLKNLDLDCGNHEYAIVYSGNDEYKGFTLNGTFYLDYMYVYLYHYVFDSEDFNPHSMVIHLSPLATGNIKVLLNNETYYNKDITGNHMGFEFAGLPTVGTYEYQVIYSNGNFDDRIKTGSFVDDYYFEINPEIDNNVSYETTFEVKMYVEAGPVTVVLGNKTHTINLTPKNSYLSSGSLTLSNSELLKADSIVFSHKTSKFPLKTIEIDISQLNILKNPVDTRKDRSSSFYFEELSGNYLLGESRSFGIGCLDFDYDEDLSTVSFLVDGNEVGVQDLCEYEPSDIDPLGGNFIDLKNLDLDCGEHEYAIVYSGNDEYKGFTLNGTFCLYYIDVAFPHNVDFPAPDEFETYNMDYIEIIISPLATGNIKVLIDNETYYESVSKTVYLNFKKVSTVGTHEYQVIYSGGNFDDYVETGVFDLDYYFELDYETDNLINYETTFNVELYCDAGPVTVILGNKTYTIDLTSAEYYKGVGSLTLSNSELLNAESIVFSNKNDFYPLKTIELDTHQLNLTFKSVPEITIDALDSVVEGSDLEVNVTVSGATGVVVVNGKEYMLVDGVANVIIQNASVGDLAIDVIYKGDDTYFNASSSKTVTVYAKSEPVVVDPVITGKNTTAKYLANAKYAVTVYGSDGNPASGVNVVFKINGKQVAKVPTNENGKASYTIKKTPGTYTITATALGKSVSNKLTVKHLVTLKKVKVRKSAKKLVLTATLSKVNGKYIKYKKVIFKFKGKKYTAKTNKKGVAKLTIKSKVLKKLKVGNKVTYQATYKGDTVKKTVKVKK